jgi:hypothetical protein
LTTVLNNNNNNNIQDLYKYTFTTTSCIKTVPFPESRTNASAIILYEKITLLALNLPVVTTNNAPLDDGDV